MRELRAAADALFDRLPFGSIVVDGVSRVVMINAAARAVCTRADALLLSHGALRAVRRADTRRLRQLISQAASPVASFASGARAIRITRLSGAGALSVLIVPARIDLDPLLGRPGLALVLFGEGQVVPHAKLLAEMYDLTPRETDFACAMVRGEDIASAATALGTSLHTARTHVRRLLQKTSTSRQAHLVALLFQSTLPHTPIE